MGKISFVLNRKLSFTRQEQKSKTPLPIYFRYSIRQSTTLTHAIGFNISPEDWDFNLQRPKNRMHILAKEAIKQKQANLEKYFTEYDFANKAVGYTPSYKEARKHLDKFYSNGEEEEQVTFFGFIDQFIKDAEHKPNAKTGKPVAKNTLNNYRSTKANLESFQKENYKISFDKISLDFYYDFIDWCNKKELSKNYIGKHIKVLKTFLNEALEQGVTTNTAHKNTKFKILGEEIDHIYLTVPELERISKLDLSETPALNIARDLFLIGAFTGLRVSDFNHLSAQNIKMVNGIQMFKVKAKKTADRVAIPLHPIVLNILKSNEGKPPKTIPDRQINKHLKKIGQLAELNDVESITKTIGGKEVTKNYKRFELVSSHTARRSFCTNAYLAGMATLDIMAISGHRTEQAFMTYIKVTAEQTAIKMAEHPFFQGSTVSKATSKS